MLPSVFNKGGICAVIAEPGQLCKSEVDSIYVPNKF